MQEWLTKYLPASLVNILTGLWYAFLLVLILIFINTDSGKGVRYWGL